MPAPIQDRHQTIHAVIPLSKALATIMHRSTIVATRQPETTPILHAPTNVRLSPPENTALSRIPSSVFVISIASLS